MILTKRQRDALSFAQRYPGLQSYAYTVRVTILRLAELGLVTIYPRTCQFKITRKGATWNNE